MLKWNYADQGKCQSGTCHRMTKVNVNQEHVIELLKLNCIRNDYLYKLRQKIKNKRR